MRSWGTGTDRPPASFEAIWILKRRTDRIILTAYSWLITISIENYATVLLSASRSLFFHCGQSTLRNLYLLCKYFSGQWCMRTLYYHQSYSLALHNDFCIPWKIMLKHPHVTVLLEWWNYTFWTFCYTIRDTWNGKVILEELFLHIL